jgi:hypothetical protein
MNNCEDCGKQTLGVRCRACNGRFQALKAAQEKDEDDRALLAMVESEKLSAERLGNRLGLSKPGAWKRIRKAKARQDLLRRSPQGVYQT